MCVFESSLCGFSLAPDHHRQRTDNTCLPRTYTEIGALTKVLRIDATQTRAFSIAAKGEKK